MKLNHTIHDKIKIKDSNLHGKGVFANENIDKDLIVPTGIFKNESIFISNFFRYLNHSYNPNIEILSNKNTIFFKTLKNIKKGSELTVNYDDSELSMNFNQSKKYDFEDLFKVEKVKTNIPFIVYKIRPKTKNQKFLYGSDL